MRVSLPLLVLFLSLVSCLLLESVAAVATKTTTTTTTTTTGRNSNSKPKSNLNDDDRHNDVDKPGIQSFHLLPTAQHLPQHVENDERTRRLIQDNMDNAIYSLLPKQGDDISDNNNDNDIDNHKTKEAIQDFHAHRHLSRYERQYRTVNHFNLHSNWDGFYSNFTIPALITDNDRNEKRTNDTTSTPTSTRALRRSLSQNEIRHHEGGRYNNYQHVPLSQGYGTHYAHVWIGTPTPSRHSVIVDTGSHFTALPCKGCDGCGEQHHTDPYYDYEKSETFRVLQCNQCQMEATCSTAAKSPSLSTTKQQQQHHPRNKCVFSQSYTEGSSWEAYQVEDTFYCAGNDVLGAADPHDQEYAIRFMFGCQTSETGLFVTQLADGIMGMSAHEATLTNKMYKHGKLEHNLFTMCFRRELQTSKLGVTAGTMTLGGIDTKLDSSPMVYAQNMAQSGWFTVHVQNIFIRTNGGQSASLATSTTGPQQHIMKIPLDLHAVNSGKGVIVDSGTTDTYLNSKLASSFNKVWKQVIGREYTHSPISLTKSQLIRLPTILVQMKAYDSRYDPTRPKPENEIGRVGSLDPRSPNDVLIAIPATNYMEYSPQTNLYTSRLYFTETSGGVIGANAMQGHNVLFDWENGRVGFAESSCHYTNYHNFNPQQQNQQQQQSSSGGSFKDESEVSNDCMLSQPTLSETCVQSVDVQACQQNPDTVLQGTEKWTLVVENAGTELGLSCVDAAILNTPYDGPNPPVVECDGNGLCYEYRPCMLSCNNVKSAASALTPLQAPTSTTCGPSLWGACDYSCTQSRLQSTLMSDNICHETSKQTRPCHIGACGRSDPCKVPFVVHAIMVFHGADIGLWDKQFEERLAETLTVSTQNHAKHGKTLFKVGDVSVIATSPWYSHDEGEATGNEDQIGNTEVLGIKAVVEISIFNAKAHLTKRGKEKQELVQKQQQKDASLTMKDRIKGLIQPNQQQRENSLKEPLPSACSERELYPLATSAMEVQEIMGSDNFVQSLLVGMRQNEEQLNVVNSSPFRAIYNQRDLAIHSRVVSSWTIRTEIDDLTRSNRGNMQTFTILVVGCIVCALIFFYRVRYSTKLGDGAGELYQLTSFESAVIDGIRSRLEDARKGRYTEVGTNAHDNDNGAGSLTTNDEDILELIMSRSMSSRSTASSKVSDISDLVSEKAAIELVGRRRKPSQKH